MRSALFPSAMPDCGGRMPWSCLSSSSKRPHWALAGSCWRKRPHLSPMDVTPERIERLKQDLAPSRVGMRRSPAIPTSPAAQAIEVPYVEMPVAYVASLARLAAELDCRIVRVFTAYESPGRAMGTLWPRSGGGGIRECCGWAAEHGVMIAVQNRHDLGVHTQALLELLCDVERPNCRLGFDAWSPALRGEDLYESARQAATYAVLTTNADYIGSRGPNTNRPW